MLELYSIHNRNVGASLIEINEGMSELLDKQVDKEMKIKIPGFMQALVKCAMKIKERKRKKRLPHKFFLLKGGLYKAVSEDWLITNIILTDMLNKNSLTVKKVRGHKGGQVTKPIIVVKIPGCISFK